MDNGLGLLIVLAVFIGIFVVLREFWCWYWKINAKLSLQEDILRELKHIKKSIGEVRSDDS
ncbi:hypothetical protein [uncultured Vibrio sp.]|uniref:hypothetical protein n=1 Tax=uncultured Vibrio sp. TaxID=114054 RepID=UPI002AA8148C|nr:hypothetical protein [uncultured Vibrio sp.]